jgi:hypothetical protein
LLNRLRDWLNRPTISTVDRMAGCLESIYHTEADRRRRGVVAIEFGQELIRQMDGDWSAPIQMKFIQMESGEWALEVRNVALAVYERAVAEKAMRQ